MEMKDVNNAKLEKAWLESDRLITAIRALNDAGLHNDLQVLYTLQNDDGRSKTLHFITYQNSYGNKSYGFFKLFTNTMNMKGAVWDMDLSILGELDKNGSDLIEFDDLIDGMTNGLVERSLVNSNRVIELARKIFTTKGNTYSDMQYDVHIFNRSDITDTGLSEARAGTYIKGGVFCKEVDKGSTDINWFLPSDKDDNYLKAFSYDALIGIETGPCDSGPTESYSIPIDFNYSKSVLFVMDNVGGCNFRCPILRNNGNRHVFAGRVFRHDTNTEDGSVRTLPMRHGDEKRAFRIDLLGIGDRWKSDSSYGNVAGFFLFRFLCNEGTEFEKNILLSFDYAYLLSNATGDKSFLDTVIEYISTVDRSEVISGVGYATGQWNSGRIISTLRECEFEFKEDVMSYRDLVCEILERLK